MDKHTDSARQPKAVGASAGREAAKPTKRRQVTLDGLGKAAATQRWQVGLRAAFGNRVSRRRR
jgi:hypothetical protein